MPHNPPEEPASEGGSRTVAVLLLLLLIGLPLIVVSGLFVVSPHVGAADGAQPGGVLSGLVADSEDQPIAGVSVMLWLSATQDDGSVLSSLADKLAPAVSAADGRFEIAAPAFEGHYQLVTESDLWIGASQSVSLIDDAGEPVELEPVVFTLEPACLLRLDLVDEAGEALGDGEFDLTGSLGSGGFGLAKMNFSTSGSIRGGLLERGSLRPGEVHISIQMDDGKTAEITRTLAPGIIRDRIEL